MRNYVPIAIRIKNIHTEQTGLHLFEGNTALDIKLKNVSYQYVSNNKPLNNCSVDIKAGSKIAIVAESGAGKTTLADLMTGLRLATEGQLLINDIDLRLCHLPSLRQKMALLHRAEIQQASILNNLLVGSTNIKLEQVNEVLKQLNLLEVILDLPHGLETELNVGGAPLSSVQVKLLAVARAVLHNPKLLVVDGLMDEIDATAQQLVHALLMRLQDCTVVVMTRSNGIANSFPLSVVWKDINNG